MSLSPFKPAEVDSFDSASATFQRLFQEAVDGGKLGEFRALCREAMRAPPTDPCVPLAFAFGARALLHDVANWQLDTSRRHYTPSAGLIAALEEDLSAPAAISHRDNYYYPIIWGIRHYIADEVDLAFRHFAMAAQKQDFYRVIKSDLGGGAAFARNYPSSAELVAARRRFNRSLRCWSQEVAAAQLVISISFDEVYFRAFAAGWLRSLATLPGRPVAAHFHVMFRQGHDEAELGRVQALARELGLELCLSLDEQVTQDRAYFASARFLYGAAILRQFGKPVLFCDADSYIADPDRFLAAHLPKLAAEQRVLGFIAEGPWNGYLPWRRFSATWLFSPPRPEAQAFFEAVADAIAHFWDARGRNWWIDQVGLEVGHRYTLRAQGHDSLFGRIQFECPNLLATGEDYKKDRINALPEMQALSAQGFSYWEALHKLQAR